MLGPRPWRSSISDSARCADVVILGSTLSRSALLYGYVDGGELCLDGSTDQGDDLFVELTFTSDTLAIGTFELLGLDSGDVVLRR